MLRGRLTIIAVTVLVSVPATSAWAKPSAANLKRVQITDGSRVDLIFDAKVSPGQVQTEYFNDIIQLSLRDVSVYPAKISTISGMDLTKVFAYQYAPRLVRCRLTVKGKAEDFKDRVQVRASGKLLSVQIAGSEDKVVTSAAKTEEAPSRMSAEEKALLNRVLAHEDSVKAAPAAPKAASIEERVAATQPRLGGAKPLPSPFRAMGMLGVVLALFGGLALVVKKFRGGSLEAHKGFSRFSASVLGKLTKGAQGGKMIEVVASHYLGPKKSISIVKVNGRLLVLGVTDEAINLITQMPAGADPAEAMNDLFNDDETLGLAPATGAMKAGPAMFADMMNVETSRPAPKAPTVTKSESVRDRIRNRVEGMKQL